LWFYCTVYYLWKWTSSLLSTYDKACTDKIFQYQISRINKTWWKVWFVNGLEVMMVSKLQYMTCTFMILRMWFCFPPPNYVNIRCILFSIIGFHLFFNVALIVHINYVVYISCVLERIRERNQRKIVLYNIDKCLVHES
jgi:hypothetical protein